MGTELGVGVNMKGSESGEVALTDTCHQYHIWKLYSNLHMTYVWNIYKTKFFFSDKILCFKG